jgi:hypothetical protein
MLVAGLLMNACKEPDDIGLNIQPQGDMLNIMFSDTTSIIAYSFFDSKLNTRNASLNLLGSIHDPIFGTINAGFCTQFEPTAFNIGFGHNPVIDSLVLVLAYNSYYGDTSTAQTVKVYELNEKLDQILPKDTIFSNHTVQYDIFTELADYSFYPRPTTKIKIDTNTLSPQLRIRLSDDLAEKFIFVDSTVYSSDAKFQNFFKGLYVVTNPVNTDGSICYFNLNRTDATKLSKLVLYYHNDTIAKSQSFVVDQSSCITFNKFEHNNYQDASQLLKDQINGNKSLGDSLLYLQAMSGLSVNLSFPYLQNWYNEGKILINRAELVITAEENGTYIDDYYACPKLGLGWDKNNSHYILLDDDTRTNTSSVFGGVYNKTTKEYSFNITRHIQYLLDNNITQTGLYMPVYGSAINASRLIFKGSKRSVGRLRLNLTYTKLY